MAREDREVARVRRTLTVLLCGTVIAAAAVACGGGGSPLSKADYQKKVSEIGNRFSDTLENVFSDPALQDPSSLKEAAGIIRDGADVIRDAADELAGLNPPAEVDSSHDKLVDGLREFADDLDGFAQATEDGNLDAINAFNEQVQHEALSSMKKIQQALDEFKAAGYDVESGT